MKKNEIIAIIAKIRNANALTKEEETTISAMSLQDWADLLNAGESVNDLADKAAKAETARIKEDKCASLLSMEREEMFREFIANPYYTGQRIVLDKKTSAWKVADIKKQLNFYDLNRAFQVKNAKETDENGKPIANKAVTIAEDAKFDIYLRMFLDNVAHAIADDVKTKAPELTDTKAAAKAEAGMDGYGLAKLEGQLRKVCAAILPESITPKMLKEDVRFIREAASSVKFSTIMVFNEKAMMNAIFMAIKVRSENGKYEMKSRAACHRAKKEG